MSNSLQVTRMANSIGDFFRAAYDREAAIAEIANHMKLYWHRKLREKLIAQLDREEDGLDELPREAIRSLAAKPPNLIDISSG